jgi:hypothetical protein
VLEVTGVKNAKVTIRPASCSGRPTTPNVEGEPWPNAPKDCPSWYLHAVTHDDGKCESGMYLRREDSSEHRGWSHDDWPDVDAPCWEKPHVDLYTKCESGSCYFIDVHFELGGKDLASRTELGKLPNDRDAGWEKGMFFMYDPSIEPEGHGFGQGQGLAGWLIALIVLLSVLGVAVMCALIWWFWGYQKKLGANESTPLKDPLKEAAVP